MSAAGLEPDVISYTAVISTCERASQWALALELRVLPPAWSPQQLGQQRARGIVREPSLPYPLRCGVYADRGRERATP